MRAILDYVRDAAGDEWAVFESRSTPQGWPILLGRPTAEMESGRFGRGAPRTILTLELLDFLTAHRMAKGEQIQAALGVSQSSVKRLKLLAGINYYDDSAAWWEARLGDLRSMTLTAFSEKHGVSIAAASLQHAKWIGRINRKEGWYREPAAKEALMSDQPASTVALFLGISVGAVGRLRSQLAAEGEANPVPAIERMRANRKGIQGYSKERSAKFKAMVKKPWSDRRRAARSADLHEKFVATGQRPINPDRPDWTPEEDSLLGTTLDSQVAAQIGRTVPAIRGRRKALKIAAYRVPWSMPVPRSTLAKQIQGIVKRRYDNISNAVRSTGLEYKVLWAACDGRKGTRESTLDAILEKLRATREDLERPS